MYSIVEIQGKQYRVETGAVLRVDRLDLAGGAAVPDIKVLLHKKSDEDIQVGKPYVSGVKVSAKVIDEVRGEKVVAVRYKPKSGYTKTHGHRQRYTRVQIDSIG